MFSRLKAYVAKHLIEELPVQMDACFDCKALRCDEANFQVCPLRLQRLAEITNARSSGPVKRSAAAHDASAKVA